MKKAFVFPGQGAQFVGMGKDLYENSPEAKELFEKANEILGFRITDLMFEGTDEDGSGSLAGRILRTCCQWHTFFRRWPASCSR